VRLLNTLTFLARHPLTKDRKLSAFARFIAWQLRARLVPGPVAVNFVNNSQLLVERGMTGATGNVYAGLHEFEEMSFVLHCLRPQELFVDVGANIGSYTILATAVVGAKCLAYEPGPGAYQWLIRNVNLNGVQNSVVPRNIGVGGEKGVLLFSRDQDTVNHVLIDGEKPGGGNIPVEVEPLDVLVGSEHPVLIKIDVEGYETAVIAGAQEVLRKESLIGVLMELNDSGRRYGYNDENLHSQMLDYGFKSFKYHPFERVLQPLEGTNRGSDNTIYLRDIEKIMQRVKGAPAFNVLGQSI